MAGDWIKWTKGLPDKPEVVRLGGLLALPRDSVVVRLMRFWEWCDENIADDAIQDNGSAFVTLSPSRGDNVAFVDALVGTPRFADSLASVGWLRLRDDRLELPNFGRHNGETAKTRARNAKNQNRKRTVDDSKSSPGKGDPVTNMSPPAGDKTVTRGEESIPSLSETGDLREKPPRTKKPPDGLHHEFVRAFVEPWEEKYRAKFPFVGAKHGSAVKWFRAQVGDDLARFRGIVSRFLADPEPFVAERRHDLGLLQSQFAKWAVDKAPPPEPARRPPPEFGTTTPHPRHSRPPGGDL